MKNRRDLVGKCHAALLLATLLLVCLPFPAMADGIIIPRPPDPVTPWRDVPLSVRYHHVDVRIVDQVATTQVDQVFVNDAPYTVEGTYIFPLPTDAALSSFDMTVDGVRLEGRLLSKDEARAIYERIVREQKDPALLEYVGRGAYQASIFPIPPGAERRIRLSYEEILPKSAGLVHYRYPLNTEKFSARPLQDVSVTVQISAQLPIRAIYSPSHAIDLTREDARHASASYEARDVTPDQDFDLYFSTSRDAVDISLMSYRPAGEDGFFLLLLTPPLEARSHRGGRQGRHPGHGYVRQYGRRETRAGEGSGALRPRPAPGGRPFQRHLLQQRCAAAGRRAHSGARRGHRASNSWTTWWRAARPISTAPFWRRLQAPTRNAPRFWSS